MFVLYNIVINFAIFVAKILSPFLPKLRERNKNIKKSLVALRKLDPTTKTIWFHSASMGEFEQVKSIIELIKSQDIDIQILCTFFSPSGYNTQQNYEYADAICYLPYDTYYTSKKFVKTINPAAVVFVRYELWYNYISIINKKNINLYLINATFPTVLNKYSILKPFYRKIFNKFNEIYSVSKKDTVKFNEINVSTRLIQSSDTRFDRIMKKVEEAKTNSVIPKKLFANDEIILVAGSTWNKDVDVILEAYAKYKKNNSANLRLIIVPHEPTLKNIEYISNKISNTILLSEILELNNIFSANLTGKIIIVDSIGKLLKLYGIADAAYIGGAFGVGVHSITEPAGYGIPLVTGPNCYNSPDTQELSEQNALTIINNSESLYQWFVRINEKTYCEKYGAIAKNYIESNCGATVKITNKIILDLIKENI